jgi:hypothetical protein
MSEQKLTPLMKFKETIKVNYDSFEDKGFYDFLLAVADKHIKKEKKVIAKAYDNGASEFKRFIESQDNPESVQPVSGIDYYEFKYDQKSFNKKFIEESELESILESAENDADLKEKLLKRSADLQEPPLTENDSKIKKFCKTLSENPISINEESEVATKEQIEELLLNRLKEVGIEPKSVKIIKL